MSSKAVKVLEEARPLPCGRFRSWFPIVPRAAETGAEGVGSRARDPPPLLILLLVGLRSSFFPWHSADEQQPAPKPGPAGRGGLAEAELWLECASAPGTGPPVSRLDEEADTSGLWEGRQAGMQLPLSHFLTGPGTAPCHTWKALHSLVSLQSTALWPKVTWLNLP